MATDVPPERRDDRTKNGFLANFQTSVTKSRFRKTGGAALGEPEVISTRGFHCWKLDTRSRAWNRKKVRILLPLPVSRVTKSKMSKSHLVKTGHTRSHAAGKPEAVFARSLHRLTEDGQLRSAQKIP
jgi:hypothetical protein